MGQYTEPRAKAALRRAGGSSACVLPARQACGGVCGSPVGATAAIIRACALLLLAARVTARRLPKGQLLLLLRSRAVNRGMLLSKSDISLLLFLLSLFLLSCTSAWLSRAAVQLFLGRGLEGGRVAPSITTRGLRR